MIFKNYLIIYYNASHKAFLWNANFFARILSTHEMFLPEHTGFNAYFLQNIVIGINVPPGTFHG
jgi:hypothetical protein